MTSLHTLYYHTVRTFVRLFLSVMFRYECLGRENFPSSETFLIVSNHQSYLDPILLGALSPRPLYYMARASLFVGPFGWLCRSMNAVPVDRNGGLKGLRHTISLLKENKPLAVFPEGTRTPDGTLQALKPGFTLLARRAKVQIIPVAISGAYEALPRGRFFPRFKKITLHAGKPISAATIASLSDTELSQLISEEINTLLLSTSSKK